MVTAVGTGVMEVGTVVMEWVEWDTVDWACESSLPMRAIAIVTVC
jgi:hypothetical protein